MSWIKIYVVLNTFVYLMTMCTAVRWMLLKLNLLNFKSTSSMQYQIGLFYYNYILHIVKSMIAWTHIKNKENNFPGYIYITNVMVKASPGSRDIVNFVSSLYITRA